MKFGKEFTAQMVQEWQEAYMDYNSLKEVLKDMMRYREQHAQRTPTGRLRSLRRRQTLYRAFSGLTGRYRGSPKKNDDEAILVSAVEDGSEDSYYYQTMFLRSTEDGGEKEIFFFRRLDEEFNKVVRFYQEKVDEAERKGEELSKQIDALIALRIRVDRPRVAFSQEIKAVPNSGNMSSADIPASVDRVKQGVHRMEAIQEVEMSSEGVSEAKTWRAEAGGFRPAPLEVLGHVKIIVDPETPVSTLRNVIGSSKSEISFSKEELRKAEEKLRQALIEFYHQLRLLKSYCFLNMLAFSKIMKKYDKITLRGASQSYLEMVDKSYLGTSDEVNRIIERVEATFVKHFANGNRRKGMKSLRPGHKEERHRTTFFLGFLTGCSIALIVAMIIIIHLRGLLNHHARGDYMENIFPLYSLFGYIVLHMIMFGGDMYFWRRYRVNYPFIFGFKPGTELGFREVLLAASGLSVLALAGMIANLDMEVDPRTQRYKTVTELVPLALVVIVFLITVCPFNIMYRSSRYILLHCLWRCICAPLYKVTLPDFFLVDQLTSQVQAFRDLIFYGCYYGWGYFRERSNKCNDSDVYKILYIVIAILPFWSRVLQCFRRLLEEKDGMHGLNCLKYLSTVVALVTRTIYGQRRGSFWRIIAASTSGVTTVYNTYWDIVIDWGLLQKDAKNPWLRDKLLISNNAVYFVAIVVNILLRLVWMQLVLDFEETSFLHRKAMIAIVAILEILRRGIWNFFRLENEHFNNVGKFRAFKSIPLPFHYEDEKII